ncbi:Cysteine and histidine-rich domain-containing protein [Halotydeus destructor]|nr:Cysteine and histidine-rich domain-containing protein [Halotydeus destructor]
MAEELLCYNRGCGQTYKEQENQQDSCLHHPGIPFFHETYKGWTCCNKKSTDFTEFLNIRGCENSKHSNVKPPEPEKPVETVTQPEPEEIRKPVYVPMERPPANSPMVPVQRTVNTSLSRTLESLKLTLNQVDGEGDKATQIGSSCHNKGCKGSYNGPQSDAETCIHHEGVPVFHEGMKYWTCCQRKTTDFDAFLEQVGCIEGKHCWTKPKVLDEDVDKSKSCRFDWHQTATHVVVAFYTKTPIPEKSKVEASCVRLHVSIIFGSDQREFENTFDLFGQINVAESDVTFFGTKVEISMKKLEPVNWATLILPELG